MQHYHIQVKLKLQKLELNLTQTPKVHMSLDQLIRRNQWMKFDRTI